MADVRPNQAGLEALSGPEGPVYRFLADAGLRVETQAKLNATGLPVAGANNPDGRGPRVQTGRLRASIGWAPGRDAQGPFVDIGTDVVYGKWLETGLVNGATYPFLKPALATLGAGFLTSGPFIRSPG